MMVMLVGKDTQLTTLENDSEQSCEDNDDQIVEQA